MESESVEEVTKEIIEGGGVLALLYFDVHTNKKEDAENMLVDLSKRLTKENGVVYALSNIQKSIKLGDKFSSSAETKILTKSLKDLARICTLYGPMGVEIQKPNKFELSIRDAQELLFLNAQLGHEFATTLLYKVLDEKGRANLMEKLKKRAKLGKKFLEEGEETEEGKEKREEGWKG